MFKSFENKTNAEVYYYAFHSLMMRHYPDRKSFCLGNSQREQFLPVLNNILDPYKKLQECRVLDVGAGSGEIIDLYFQSMRHAIISLEEPNKLLLEKYIERIQHYKNLETGKVFPGLIQDLLWGHDGRYWLQNLPEQQIILAIHMIYNLTNFNTDAHIDPEYDITEMISTLYEKLSIGGTLILIYAEQLESIIGRVSYKYYIEKSLSRSENINKIWITRKQLLREGGIASVLQDRYPEVRCIFESSLTMSRIYAYNEYELAIMCLIGEMGVVDSEKFDIDKLYFIWNEIHNRRMEFNIFREYKEGARKGMLSGSQPQVICVIKKSECKIQSL